MSQVTVAIELSPTDRVTCELCRLMSGSFANHPSLGQGDAWLCDASHEPLNGEANYICNRHLQSDVCFVSQDGRRIFPRSPSVTPLMEERENGQILAKSLALVLSTAKGTPESLEKTAAEIVHAVWAAFQSGDAEEAAAVLEAMAYGSAEAMLVGAMGQVGGADEK